MALAAIAGEQARVLAPGRAAAGVGIDRAQRDDATDRFLVGADQRGVAVQRHRVAIAGMVVRPRIVGLQSGLLDPGVAVADEDMRRAAEVGTDDGAGAIQRHRVPEQRARTAIAGGELCLQRPVGAAAHVHVGRAAGEIAVGGMHARAHQRRIAVDRDRAAEFIIGSAIGRLQPRLRHPIPACAHVDLRRAALGVGAGHADQDRVAVDRHRLSLHLALATRADLEP